MKYLIGFILAAIVFLLGYCTGQNSVDPCPEPVYIIDTSTIEKPPVEKETIKPKPFRSYTAKNLQRTFKETCKEDHLPDTGKKIEVLKCETISIYRDTLRDSSGTVITEDSVRGEILKKKIKLIPKFMVVRETKVVPKFIPQAGFFIGIEAGIGPYNRLAPEVSYLTKKGWEYSYNYDFINKVHSGGVKKLLRF